MSDPQSIVLAPKRPLSALSEGLPFSSSADGRSTGRWRRAAVASLVLSALAVAAIYLVVSPSYRVSALLEVHPARSGALVIATQTQPGDDQYIAGEVIRLRDRLRSGQFTSLLADQLEPLATHHVDPLAYVQQSLRVEAVEGTALIQVSMIGDQPQLLAALITKLVHEHLRLRQDLDRERVGNSVLQLEQDAQAIAAQLAALTSARETAATSGDAPVGLTPADVNSRLAQLSQQLTQLEQAQALKEGRREQLSSFRRHSASAQTQPILPEEVEKFFAADNLLQTMRTQQQELQSALLQDERDGKMPAHPVVRDKLDHIERLNARIAARERSLLEPFVDETIDVLTVELADIQAQIAVIQEESNQLHAQREVVAQRVLKLEQLEEQRLRLEAQYDQLNGNIQDVKVAQDQASRVTVHTEAEATARPNYDPRPVYAGLAVLACMCVGFSTALTRRRLLDHYADPTVMSEVLGIDVLGGIEYITNGNSPVHALDRRLIEPAATGTALSTTNDRARVRMITSPAGTRGQTAFAINLARYLCSGNKRVLLIDAAVDSAALSARLALSEAPGLTDCVEGCATPEAVIHATADPGMFVMPAGTAHTPDTAKLLNWQASGALDSLAEQFHDILIEAPPVLNAREAVMIASVVDEVILLLLPDQLHYAKQARQLLQAVGCHVVGVALNTITS